MILSDMNYDKVLYFIPMQNKSMMVSLKMVISKDKVFFILN